MIGPDALARLNAITDRIIGAAIEVHRWLGPGLLESTYENATRLELDNRGIAYRSQPTIAVHYKGTCVGQYRLDLIVENAVVVEIKSVERLDPVFEAQLLAYLRCTRLHVGLLINFNSQLLKHGIKRLIL